MSQDIYKCANCGIKEHISLLDAEIINDEPTGRLMCIACLPNWCPMASIEHDLSLSVAPTLRPLYEAYKD